MDGGTLAIALALIKKVLPATTPEDVGALLVVGANGKWTTGEATTATISVSETTLTITAAE